MHRLNKFPEYRVAFEHKPKGRGNFKPRRMWLICYVKDAKAARRLAEKHLPAQFNAVKILRVIKWEY